MPYYRHLGNRIRCKYTLGSAKIIATKSDSIKKYSTPISILIIGLILYFVKYLDSPDYQPYLNRDSGVFHYIGWEILRGKIPYIDIWDHKPPLIFFINAFGLLLSKGSSWGTWILQYLFLFSSGLISLRLLSNLWGKAIALFSTILWIISLRVLLKEAIMLQNMAYSFNLYLFTCS